MSYKWLQVYSFVYVMYIMVTLSMYDFHTWNHKMHKKHVYLQWSVLVNLLN